MHPRHFLFILLISALHAADPPSSVTAPVKEAELPTLHLTPRAVERLGLQSVEITRQSLPQSRSYLGTVRMPVGSATDALAPAPLTSPEELRLLAERQAVADGAASVATVALQAAALARERASTLAKAKVGSDKILQETAAIEQQAKNALSTADQQRALLGLPVADISRNPQRWISVAVPSLDLVAMKQAREAAIKPLGPSKEKPLPATLTARDGTALPGGMVELFFTVAGETLTLGQSVEVILPKAGTAEPALTAPSSAVIYDATGGAWVYTVKGPETFARSRVSVSRIAGETAILAAGPPAGTKIVSVGVAELFGAEFGGFK